ncbi:hypothetical protein RRG08_022860 [Elysia crispata]|uniref:Uncharacterized protein n=1 Tax=Elysia crispata TaxID=231223 RepID=A0AAE1D7V5_9GAST|nr:hypothetical protein RRG08_022860 [Elysia crispata]
MGIPDNFSRSAKRNWCKFLVCLGHFTPALGDPTNIRTYYSSKSDIRTVSLQMGTITGFIDVCQASKRRLGCFSSTTLSVLRSLNRHAGKCMFQNCRVLQFHIEAATKMADCVKCSIDNLNRLVSTLTSSGSKLSSNSLNAVLVSVWGSSAPIVYRLTPTLDQTNPLLLITITLETVIICVLSPPGVCLFGATLQGLTPIIRDAILTFRSITGLTIVDSPGAIQSLYLVYTVVIC